MTSRNLYTEQQIAGNNVKRTGLMSTLILAGMLLFGVQAIAQNYVQVANATGTTVNYNGIGVTVTYSGVAYPFAPCGVTAGNYDFTGGAGTATFTFSAPVGSVKVPVTFGSGGTADDVHFVVNGASYTLTSANFAGGSGSTCGDPTLATISGGDITNAGDFAGTPNGTLIIPGPVTSITMTNLGANACLFGILFTPNNYYHISTVGGPTSIGGNSVLVTTGGSAAGVPFYPCGEDASSPFYFTSGAAGSFTFTFGTPVTGVNVPSLFASGGTIAQEHFVVNGSGVTLTAANLLGNVLPNCGDNTLASISAGNLANTGDFGGTPNEVVSLTGAGINSVSVQNVAVGANYPAFGFFFTGSSAALSFDNSSPQSMTLCTSAGATDITSKLAVTDINPSSILTWSTVVGPSHGALVLGGTQNSTGGSVTPVGYTYQPTAGYSGNDGFIMQCSDGVNTVTTMINVTMVPTPNLTNFGTVVSANPCQGNGAVVTLNSTTLAAGIYTVTYSLAGVVSSAGNVASITMAANTGNFTTVPLGVSGGENVVITAISNACASAAPGAGFIGGFTINPSPMTPTVPGALCNGSTMVATDGSAGGTFTSSNPAIFTVGATSFGTATVTGTGVGIATATYTLIATGCYATVPVSINTQPTAITGSIMACTGSTTGLASSPGAGTWATSNVGVATVGGTGVVSGVTAGTVTISYSIGACYSLWPMTVYQTPLPITASTFTVCTGLSVPVASGTTGGIFSSSNSLQASLTATGGPGSGTANLNGVSAGNPTITYTVPSGCAVTHAVTVNTTPSAIAGANSVCIGFNTTLTDLSPAGTWTSSNPLLATIGAASGIVNGVAAGSPNITYTDPNGCFVIQLFTVNPNPAAIGGSPFTVCTGFTNTVTDVTPAGTWSSNNAGLASVNAGTGVVTGNSIGVPTISYTLATGCYAIQSYTVNQTPVATTGTNQVCIGLTTTLTNTTGGGTWSSSDGAKATVVAGTGVVTGIAAGTVNISYILGTGCYALFPMTVNANPAAIGGPNAVCAGATITATDATLLGTWSSSNTALATVGAASGIITGLSSGVPTISYTITATGCYATEAVTVNANPTAVTGTTGICVGSTSTLSSTPAGGTWTSSNVPVATIGAGSGIVTAISAGTSNITYSLGTGCYAATTVTVNPLPSAIAGTASVCVGSTTVLTDGGGGVWTSSNPGIATIGAGTGIVSGVTPGNSTITYTLPSGCTATIIVTVNPNPASISGTASACIGASSTLSDGTIGGSWSSSNTLIATVGALTGTVAGVAAGNATITYLMPTGCIATTTFTVNPLPGAIAGTLAVCTGATTSLTNPTGGGTWSSNDITKATVVAGTGVVTGVATGNPVVSYMLGTGCYATATLTVNQTPVGITGTANVCVGLNTTLADATAGPATWSSSNTALATVGAGTGIVTGVAAGTPNVTYTINATGCYAFTPVTVNPNPAAIGGTAVVCVGSTAVLTDATSGGTWSTSNGALATVGATTGLVTGVSAGNPVITYTLPTGCINVITITVNPLPAAISGPTNVCTGFSITLNDATGTGTWTSSNPALATIGLGTGIVNGLIAGVPVMTYTLATGCYATYPVTVNPTPAAITGVIVVCVGSTTTLADATSGGIWSSSNGAQATIGAGTGTVAGVSAGNPNMTYTVATGCYVTTPTTINPLPAGITGVTNVCIGLNTTLADGTPSGSWTSSNTTQATVGALTGVVNGLVAGTPIITYTLPTGCYTTTPVTVNPNPTGITGTGTVCTGFTTTLASTPGGGTWSTSNGAIATAGAGTGVVSGIAAGNATITYSLSTGCLATTIVTVNQTPAAITGTTNVCIGLTTTLNSATLLGTWSSGNLSQATVGVTGIVTGVAAGVPIISYTMATGCYVTTPVTVNPNPAAITGTNTVCTGSTVGLANTTAGGTWSSSDATKATINAATGVVTGVAAGNPTMTYTLATGCLAVYPMTVNTTPAAITGITTVCTGFTTTLSSATLLGTWTSSNTAEATVGGGTGIVNGVSAGTPTITYTMASGCYVTTNVTVNTTPPATTGTASVCVGLTTVLSNTLAGGTWSSTNPAMATVGAGTGIVTGFATGNPVVSYTMPTGCYTLTNITVNPTPAAVTGPGVVCVGSNITMSDATAGGIWSSGNTSTAVVNAATGVVTGVAAGSVSIIYTLGAGCTASTTITVNPVPNITNFTSTIATSECVGLGGTVTVTSNTLGVGAFTVTYNLSGANAATGVTATLTMGATNGTFTIPSASLSGTGFTTVTITGISNGFGCTSIPLSNNTSTFSVYPLPTVYNVTGGGGYCAGGTGVHVYLSNSVGGINYQLWNGATAVGAPMAGTFSGLDFGLITTASTYSVTATNATTGCSNNMFGSVTVFINPLPTNTFTVTGGGSYCAGGTGVAVGLSSTQAGISYQLYLAGVATGSPISGAGAAISFGLQTSAGVYTVVGTNTTTLCTSTMTGSATVVVNPLPSAIAGILLVCPGQTTTLTDASTGGTWSSTTPGVAIAGAATGVVSGVSAGTATIIYTLPTTCSISAVVTVNPLPSAIAGLTSVCAGSAITLTDPTSGGTWTSSNTLLATINITTGIVSGIAAGTPTITYTLPTGCFVTFNITVNPTPVAITGATNVCIGSTTTLVDLTSGGTWSSSAAAVATINAGSGLVTGVTAGTVTMTYTLAAGCYATYAMTVNPVPAAIAGTFTVCNGSTTTLTDATTGGSWSSSNIAIATVGVGSGVVTGASVGTVTITYTLPAGCYVVTNVTVNPIPAAITGTNNVCSGLTTTLSDAVSGGTWSSSNGAVAAINAATGVVTGGTAGSATITYTLPAGCLTTFAFTTNPLPSAITGTGSVCIGSTTTLADASTGGTWSSSNPALGSVVAVTGVVTGVAVGNPVITYTLPTGCLITTIVTVNPLPAAITGITSVCAGLTTTLSDASAGGTWSTSNPALATVVAGTGVVSGISAGNPTITYTLPTGCLITTPITVNPSPAAISGSNTVCVGFTTALTNAVTGGSWSSSNPTLASVNAVSGVVSGLVVGTPIITYNLPPGGCITTMMVSVNPQPVAITGTLSVCAGSTTTLSDASTGGSWSSANTSIATVNAGSGVVTGVGAGTVTISYALPAGCFVTATVTVNPTPVAITGTNSVCVGLTTALADLSTGGTWSSSNVAQAIVNGVTGVVTGVSAGTPIITYTLPVGSCYTIYGITVNPLPASISGSTVVCVGGSSTLTDASTGGSWTSGNPSLASIGGTTGIITGIAAGTLNYTYTLPTGCITTTVGTVNVLPTIYNVTGGGTYCAGGTGVTIGLNGSTIGVNYQLMNGGATVGFPIAGTGSALVFGPIFIAATYTIVATNATTSCQSNMNSSATVTVSVLPTVFNMTGGGGYCAGGAGMAVGLNGSTSGVNYQLFYGILPIGTPFAGTGGAFSFGVFSGAGTYTVVATNASTGCVSNMAGTSVVVANPLPTAYNVTGGGSYCTGGTGVHVNLSNSTVGVNYQLLISGLPVVGAILPGTGSPLDFGLITTAGNYTIQATKATTSCTGLMTGAASVVINALPTNTYTIAPGTNSFCTGGSSAAITLSSSQTGVNYQLYNGLTPAGVAIPGTGGLLTFAPQVTGGTYTIIGTNAITGCTNTMTGTSVLTALALPRVFHIVSGSGGAVCPGLSTTISLDSTLVGTNYRLAIGGVATGVILAGTGSGITFTAISAPGTYTIVATLNATSCPLAMSGTATVSNVPAPTVYNVLVSGTTTTYCAGGTGLAITLSNSDIGIKYQLFNNGTTMGAPINGTGAGLNFGLQLASAFPYSVVATNLATGCTANMNGTPTISTLPLPTAYNVSSGGSYCAGGTGVNITLSNSAPGITYQLMNGITPVVGAVLPGTSFPLNFGPQTATGIYTVIATNTTTTCTNTMTGSGVITITPAPAPFPINGSGTYCAGGVGIPVTLTGSATGINYQLLDPIEGTLIGGVVSGTGGVISFGNITVGSLDTFVARATSTVTGCIAIMPGSAIIGRNALPTAYNVTGGGGYCVGGTGVVVGLNGSDTGVSYQLYVDGLSDGLAVAGTGSSISFGLRTATGIRTVVATRTSTGCTNTMTGSVAITINTLPAIHIVTGGGTYCPGGPGKVVGLDSGITGFNYQLYLGTAPVGAAIAGTTGLPVNFGLQTGVGTYTVMAINAATTCSSTMTGTAVISLNTLPTAYTVGGGGGYCTGGTGSLVILSGSSIGVNYQLYLGTTSVGVAMAGTGSPLTFGPLTSLGSYSVIATSTITTCSNNMTGTATVSLNPLPTAYTVTGGGSYCAGGTGLAIGLNGSDVTISYQLYKDGVADGPALAGTGSALSFGLKTASGNYSVIATNSVTSCTNSMTGTESISINPLPVVNLVTGGGAYCTGAAGVHVGLSSSDAGVNYQLMMGIATVGGPVAGVSGPLDFGYETAAGTYTVVATNALTSCTSNMSGSATVTVNPLPVSTYVVTGGGNYCAGGAGLAVGLSGSNTGISYQLYNGSTASGLPVAGAPGAISFGIQSAAGTYTVIATNITTTCTSTMSGSVVINVNPLPIVDTVTGGGNYCPGGAGNHIGLSSSTSGINYQLYRGIIGLGAPVAGTGSGLDFGLQSVVGTYFVTATDPSTGCSINMVGSPSIGISALPTAYTVMSSATGYCIGGTGVDITLNGSDVGVSYQLYLDGVAMGSPMSGTGFALNYGLKTSAGTYSIIATSSATTCSANMTGTPLITINPLPTLYTVTGGGGYCAGGAGVAVNLSGTDMGVNYQLYRGGTTSVGASMSGTGYSLSFGSMTTGGTYTVVATDAATGCISTMLSSAPVIVNSLPTAWYVVGGGSYCSGDAGVHVGINGSNTGINYRLYQGVVPVGSLLAGNDSALDFGPQSVAGTYTVIATNPVTSCTSTMTGTASVSINPLPTAFAVTGGGNYCIGGSGVHIGLGGSATGYSYQLKSGAISIGVPLAGTGAALDFGYISGTGSYTVVATNTSTGCTATMTGSVSVSISSLPAVYNVTGGGSYCASTSGVAVGLSNSDAGVNYQLYNGTSTVGGLVAGVSGPLSFGLHPAGTYTVVAINAATTCSSNMTGNAIVTVMPSVVPSVTVATGVGDTVCNGTTVTFSALPVNGGTTPAYQWYINGIPTGTTGNSYSYVPSNGNVVSVLMTSNADCPMPATATGAVTMTVRSNVTPSVTIAASPSNTVCAGTTVDVIATPVYGGSSPSYSWIINGNPVGIGAMHTYIPADGDVVFCVMNSSYLCLATNSVLSNNVTFHVENNNPPVVKINWIPNGGANPTQVSASVINGGTNPAYQWSINGVAVPGGTLDTLGTVSFTSGDAISVVVTRTNSCGALIGYDMIIDTFANVSVNPVIATASDIRLVPNPNNGTFSVKGTLSTTVNEEVTIDVTDVIGQVVYSKKSVAHNGTIDEQVQLGKSIANGMYMVNVRSANETKVFHMVVAQ